MFIMYNINHWYSKFSFCRTKSWTYTLLPTEKRWKHNDLRSRDTSRGSDDINIHAYEYSLDSRNCWKYANTLHIILHTSSDFCKNVWYIVLYFRRKSLILWDTPVPVRYDSQNVASLWLCTMYVWERERMRDFSVMCRIDCFKKKIINLLLNNWFFSKEESHELVNKTNPPLELRS